MRHIGSSEPLQSQPEEEGVFDMPRKAIPLATKREVLIEAGYRCGVPTCRAFTIDIHHIIERSKGGKDTSENLIALCPTCHTRYHRGEYARDAIQVWKGILVQLNHAFDKDAIDNLIFLKKIEHRDQDEQEKRIANFLLLSGDGTLRFANLVAAGLAKIIQFRQVPPMQDLYLVGAEHVTVVEGYFGAVRLHMLRVPTVALMGTSMSEEQVELLVRAGVERATLLLDGDDAGRQACEKLLPHLARKLFVRVGVLSDGEAPDDCEEEVLREMVEAVA